MKENFAQALEWTWPLEGGYSNDPDDPGGETNLGITKRVYDGFRDNKGQPRRSVKLIEKDEARDIYIAQYAGKVRFNDLPSGVDYAVFDGAVNSGAAQATKWLQRALGVKADGNLGEATLAAARDADPATLAAAICDRRMNFLQNLTTFRKFGKGWTARVNAVRSRSIELASGVAVTTITNVRADGAAKATIAHAKQAPGSGLSGASTGGGSVIIMTTALGQTTDTLKPIIEAHPWGQTVMAGIAVVGILCTAGGLAYSQWAKNRAKTLADALDLPTAPQEAA